VAYVFPNRRQPLVADVAAGRAPDTALLGQNHLAEHGIDARVHDPLLTRRSWPGPVQRVAWSAREPPLPWELRDADVAVAGLTNVFPLAARVRRRPAVLALNYGLAAIHRRASPARRRLLRASLRSAAGVVCFGRSQAADLVASDLVDETRAHVILYPMDEKWFPPREPAHGEPLVLAVGKDLARDYETLAAAAEGLDARVEVLAHPRNLEGVRLPANVRAGWAELPELRELYARATCVVVPQHPDGYVYGSDGGLTACLEAMASARPVVATERAILRDYLEPEVDAVVVPPRDPAALRSAIERVLGDTALALRLGRAGRTRVERAHTTRGFAAGLAPLIRSAASSTVSLR
jgi:glycosyltransferase involved in cell wall biosynthesis